MKTQKFLKIQEELKKLENGEDVELSENGLNSGNLKDFGFNYVNDYEEDEIEFCGYYMHETLYTRNGHCYISSYSGGYSAYLTKISKKEAAEKLKYIFYIKQQLRNPFEVYTNYDSWCEYVKKLRNKKQLLEEKKIGYPFFYSSCAA